jgi:hypothetical protein
MKGPLLEIEHLSTWIAHGNFAAAPEVHRGPYEYSTPGNGRDYLPQNAPEEAH